MTHSFCGRGKFPLPRPRQQFIEELVAGKWPSIGYTYLIRIVENQFIRNIFTTNFDDLLNEAFYQFSDQRPVVCAHDSALKGIGVSSARPKIIKLHGDYLFDNLNTIDETSKLPDNMAKKLREFSNEYGLLVSGYSGGDLSVMSIINKLVDDEECFPNGLFWCFRSENSEISVELRNLLEKPKVYYIIAGGFNELMADLYDRLVGKAPPINTAVNTSRSTSFVHKFIEDEELAKSRNLTIQTHLSTLRKSNNKSLIAESIAALNEERFDSTHLKDEYILLFLEVERLMRSRSPNDAYIKIKDSLSQISDIEVKQPLLFKAFQCASRLGLVKEAKKITEEALSLDTRNYNLAISVANFIEGDQERLAKLASLVDEYPFSVNVRNAYASEIDDLRYLPNCDVPKAVKVYQESVKIDPSPNNPAWTALFSLLLEDGTKGRNQRNEVESILRTRLAQRPYSSITSKMLFRYCKTYETTIFEGKELTQFLDEAFNFHFPRDEASHLAVITDACAEFGNFAGLRKILNEVITKPELQRDEDFICHLMDIHFDIFRDLAKAISIGENFLECNESTEVELKLFKFLLLSDGDDHRSVKVLQNLKGSISVVREMELEADLLERQGKFKDAIDTLEAIPDKRNFDKKYTNGLAFLDMKLDNFQSANVRLRNFLKSRNHSIHYEVETVNLEFTKSKLEKKKKVKVQKLDQLLEKSASKDIQAVCELLKGNSEKALKILVTEAEKEFSNIHIYIRWPVLNSLQDKLIEKKRELERAKRSLDSLHEPAT